MKFHSDVLAAHAEFGGDLQAMQALYDRPDHIARIAALEAQLAEKEAENEQLEKERNYWQSQHDERTRQLGMSDTDAAPPAPVCDTCNGTGHEARNAICRDCDEPTPPAQKVTATHRHKKRGSEYALIGIGKMQSDNWQVNRNGFDASIDMEEVAIYRSATDPAEIWVRPLEEFEDGRFEAITAAQEAGKP